MTDTLLDVTTLPFDQVYTCHDGFEINMRDFLASYADVIDVLAAKDHIKDNDSFGFAMMKPWSEGNDVEDDDFWDKPEEFVWFVGGWGPRRDYYIANAVRKIRPLIRYGMQDDEPDDLFSTLDLRFYLSDFFQDMVVGEQEDGTFPWGDFPWGGAIVKLFEKRYVLMSISCLTEVEDDIAANLIGGGFARLVIEHDKLLPDD